MASAAGSNMATLAAPLTALQSSISGGNLAPAAMMDAIIRSTYCAAIYNTSAGQSIPSGTGTVVNFDTQELDTDSAVATGAGWTFTCPTGKGGLYHVSAVVGFGTFNASSTLFTGVFVSSTEKHRSNRYLAGATDAVPYVSLSADVVLAAGDTVQIKVLHQAGVNKTLEGIGISNRICIHRVFGS
jgi:hypothetical protein